MNIPARCAAHLRDVENLIQFWTLAVTELPIWLERVKERTRDCTHNLTGHRRDTASKLLEALEAFHFNTDGGTRPSSTSVNELWAAMDESAGTSINDSERDDPGGLAMGRHSLINVLAPLKMATPTRLTIKLESAASVLMEHAADHPLLADLALCRRAVEQDVNSDSIKTISKTLESWHDAIHFAHSSADPRRLHCSTSQARICAALIVEDQWWGDVLEVKVREVLPHDIEVCRVRTLEEANAALDRFRSPSVDDESDDMNCSDHDHLAAIGDKQPSSVCKSGDILVFLDLGIPENTEAMLNGYVSRDHGKAILTNIRDYAVNARTIILTSPAEYMPDHVWIASHGIAPDDIILKTRTDWTTEIEEALYRAMHQDRGIARVEIDEDAQVIWLDGVEVDFTPLDFKIVSILCEELKTRPEPQRSRQAFSCSRITERLLDYYGVLSDPANIPTHIHTIRRHIHERFNEVGKSVESRQVVTTDFFSDEVRYRITARTFLKAGQTAMPVVDAVTILVVEDSQAWCDFISRPLVTAGYSVEIARDVASAIEAVALHNPTILCVDMQLPDTAANEGVHQTDGGLRVIEHVREIDPEARVVVLTELASIDWLRVEATKRGVRIHDYIDKADPDWLWKLHRSVWRLTREWQQGVDFSLGARHHVIEINRLNPRNLWIDGILIPLSKNRAKILSVLAQRVDEYVSAESLQTQIYGVEDNGQDKANSLIQLIKHVRNQIEQTAADKGRTINAKHIIAEESGGYILCGPVLYRS
ncbi:MAG TPA: response regulator [Capsulimonadaceae bacterium]|jgi:DNA-binding response OmpR family regulator